MAALFGPRIYSPYASPHQSHQPAAAEPSFHGLFRLLEDWDSHHNSSNNNDNSMTTPGSSAVAGSKQKSQPQPQPQKQQQGLTRRLQQQLQHHHQPQPEPAVFTPRFDVRETDAAYELFGDLPGVSKGDVSIEFSDPQTLVVRGHVERRSSPAPANESSGHDDGAEDNDDAVMIADHRSETSSQRSFQATVEEDKEEEDKNESRSKATTAPAAAPADNNQSTTTVATTTTHAAATEKQQPAAPRYWIAERPTGSFARTFAFPERLDIDGVTASLRDGVLALVVPKARRYEARRITLL